MAISQHLICADLTSRYLRIADQPEMKHGVSRSVLSKVERRIEQRNLGMKKFYFAKPIVVAKTSLTLNIPGGAGRPCIRERTDSVPFPVWRP